MKLLKIIKQKHNAFLFENKNIETAVNKFERFSKFYLLLSSDSFAHFKEGIQNNQRKLLVYIPRIVIALLLIQQFVTFSSKSWIKQIIIDTNYVTGNGRIISIMMSFSLSTMLLLLIWAQYSEVTRSFDLLILLQELKDRKCATKLSPTTNSKFGLRANLMAIYALQIYHKMASTLLGSGFILSLTFAYLDPNSGYSTVAVLIWAVISTAGPIYFHATIAFTAFTWYLSILFLRLKFEDLNHVIKAGVNDLSKNLLFNSIKEYNRVAVLTAKLNRYFKVVIFIGYYFGTPAIQLTCFCSHAKGMVMFARIATFMLFVSTCSLIFAFNMLSANLNLAAHRSYPLLYTFMVNYKGKLRPGEIWKIQNFIELLSGQIGFNCLNMFPMNYFEFYTFLSIAVKNYFLFLSIL